MAFWSGEKLSTMTNVVDGFSPSRIDANAYNLSVGDTYFRTVDDPTVEPKKQSLKDGEAFTIPPGQFAFLLTKEEVHVPQDAMAFISMRTMVKFQGLINVSGFHVDPGYNGRLMYSVYNASPSHIHICEGDPLFKIWFADLDRGSNIPYVFSGKPVTGISNELIRGMSREILSLQSLSDKIRDLESDVIERLSEQRPVVDNLTFVWRAVTIAVVGGLLLALLSAAWPTINSVGNDMLGTVRELESR